MDFLNSSDGIINGALSKAWQITLTSTNGTLKFVNFEPGDLFTLIVKEDSSGSAYTLSFPSSVNWQAKVAPNRDTTANAVAVHTFSYDGTVFRDTGSTGKGLPARILAAALGTLVGVAVTASIITAGNNGQGTGRPGAAGFGDIQQYKTGTGSAQVTVGKITASGSPVFGQSGSLVLGSKTLNEKGTDATFYVKPSGQTVVKNSISGSSLYLNTGGSGAVLCKKTDGSVGTCGGTVGAAGKCGPCS